jgi:hypothetical protein
MRWMLLVSLLWVAGARCGGEGEEPPAPGKTEAPPAPKAPADAALQAALSKRISVEFIDKPLGDVATELRNTLGVDVAVDPRAAERTVLLALHDIKAGFALSWIAEITGTGLTIEKRTIRFMPAGPNDPKTNAPAPVDDTDNQRVRERLRGRPISFDFVKMQFGDIVAFFGPLTNVNFIVDPALALDTPVNATATDMTPGAALLMCATFAGVQVEVRQGAVFLRSVRPPATKGGPVKNPPPAKGDAPVRRVEGGGL